MPVPPLHDRHRTASGTHAYRRIMIFTIWSPFIRAAPDTSRTALDWLSLCLRQDDMMARSQHVASPGHGADPRPGPARQVRRSTMDFALAAVHGSPKAARRSACGRTTFLRLQAAAVSCSTSAGLGWQPHVTLPDSCPIDVVHTEPVYRPQPHVLQQGLREQMARGAAVTSRRPCLTC